MRFRQKLFAFNESKRINYVIEPTKNAKRRLIKAKMRIFDQI